MPNNTNPTVPDDNDRVHVRQLTRSDVDAWVGDADDPNQMPPLEAFTLRQTTQNGTTLTPVTVTATSIRAPRKDRRDRSDDEPAGQIISCDVQDMFGKSSTTRMRTTPVTAELDGVEHDLTLYVEDPEADTVLPRTPVYGAQVTLSTVVQGAHPDDLERDVITALETQFGAGLRPLRKVRTRFVEDVRVDVHAAPATPSELGQVIAVGILEAEVSYIMQGQSVTVTEANPALAVGD